MTSRREIIALADPVTWIEDNREFEGKPFTMAEFKCWHQPLRDESKVVVILKSRKALFTELLGSKLLWAIDTHPYTGGIYLFPRNKGQAQEFSMTRFSKMIEESSLKNKVLLDNANLKQFLGKGNYKQEICIDGTWPSKKGTANNVRMKAADYMVLDELQDHPFDVMGVVKYCLKNSKYNKTVKGGTPNVSGGIFDDEWENTDQNEWFATCPVCGKKQRITAANIIITDENGDTKTWDENISKDELIPQIAELYWGCLKCHSKIDRNEGEWIPQKPGNAIFQTGYHIYMAMLTINSPWDILEDFYNPKISYRIWKNEVWGVSSSGEDTPFTIESLEKCGNLNRAIGENKDNYKYILALVDWGKSSHVYVEGIRQDGKPKYLGYHCISNSDERRHGDLAVEYLSKFKPDFAGADFGYSTSRTKDLDDGLPDTIVFEMKNVGNMDSEEKIKFSKENSGMLLVDKAWMIELIEKEVMRQEWDFPYKEPVADEVKNFLNMFLNVTKEIQEDRNGNKIIKYVRHSDDHTLILKSMASALKIAIEDYGMMENMQESSIVTDDSINYADQEKEIEKNVG